MLRLRVFDPPRLALAPYQRPTRWQFRRLRQLGLSGNDRRIEDDDWNNIPPCNTWWIKSAGDKDKSFPNNILESDAAAKGWWGWGRWGKVPVPGGCRQPRIQGPIRNQLMNEEGLIAKAMENLMCCPPWEEEARGGGRHRSEGDKEWDLFRWRRGIKCHPREALIFLLMSCSQQEEGNVQCSSWLGGGISMVHWWGLKNLLIVWSEPKLPYLSRPKSWVRMVWLFF